MKKILTLILMMTTLGSCMYNTPKSKETNTSAPDRLRKLKSSSIISVYNEFDSKGKSEPDRSDKDRIKAIWLSYIDLAPMLEGDEEYFTEEFDKACQNISSIGLDTIFVHVRPFGDALYDSDIYPPSVYICGEYDPLNIMCDIAHKNNLSLHAWINPLRLQREETLADTDISYTTAAWYSENSGKVKAVEGSPVLWLDPSYPEVRDLIAEGATEIAEKYDIDGIHYDDYFYPTTDDSFDEQCFAQAGGDISLSSWRTENITCMCKEIYSSVKNVDSNIIVSISPQGNIGNNYTYMYADVKSWCCEDDVCDIIIPQIYFGYDDPVMPFETAITEWAKLCDGTNTELMIGLAPYKIGSEGEFTNDEGIIASQIGDCFNEYEVSGVALFSYNSLFSQNDDRIIRERELIGSTLNSLK